MQLADHLLKVPKNYTYGTHRLCEPSETLEAISAHFPTLGITRVADITGLDVIGIPVCVAIRPNSRSLSVSQGKGLSLVHSQVSAAMETIELYHAENIRLEILTSSYAELTQDAIACDPYTLTLLSKAQYDHTCQLRWVKGFDLIRQRETFVPYDLVHCLLDKELIQNSLFPITSNGLASGNHLLEAVSHAICEIIERDAIYFWELRSHNPQLPIAYIDLETVENPLCRQLLEKLQQTGIDVYVWDLESRTGIPALGCAIAEKQGTLSLLSTGIYHGFGCHLSREIAFIRAVTEAAQTRLTYISGARDDIYREWYQTTQSEFFQLQWRNFLEDKHRQQRDFNTLNSLESESLSADVAIQLACLQKSGIEQAIMIDLSQPQFGISVARVIIPNMHMSMHNTMTKLGQQMKNNDNR